MNSNDTVKDENEARKNKKTQFTKTQTQDKQNVKHKRFGERTRNAPNTKKQ